MYQYHCLNPIAEKGLGSIWMKIIRKQKDL